MGRDTGTGDALTRLEAEREAAHQEYLDALAAVEQALPTELRRPTPLPPPDDHQLPTLNRFWAARPVGAAAGWRRLRTRVARYVRPLIQLLPWRQNAFNAALVDHLNRASAREHAARDATTRSLDGLHDDLGAVLAYQTSLLRFLQTNVLSYALDALRLPGGPTEALSALGDDMRKRWESVAARQQRLEAAVAALSTSHEQDAAELRLALGMLQRSSAVVEREVERAVAAAASRSSDSTPRRGPEASAALEERPGADLGSRTVGAEVGMAAAQLAGSPVTSYKYVGFEDSFRGSTAEIRERLTTYLPLFSGASDILDFGCGRGEFLDLLRQHGLTARGVDINHEMVEVCRERGLNVAEGDGLAFLEALPDGTLGGLFASQVVEHLQPHQLQQLLDLAFHKLRPGARVVLETINPACWYAFFESYIRDITHQRPLHPDTLKFLLQAGGFQQVEIRFLAPYPEAGKLQPIPIPEHEGSSTIDPLIDLAETYNANVDKINRLLFTYLDYAAVAVRP